jgi:sigma-E factor negative regulatory protein RseB
VESRSRQAVGVPYPGTDPAALRLITAAVVAGLVITGVVIAQYGPVPGGTAKLSRGGERAVTGRGSLPGAALSIAPPTRLTFSRTAPSALSRTTPSAAGPALTLLSQAAVASRTVAYEGVEVETGWTRPGPITSVLRVWHSPSGAALTQAVTPAPGWPGVVPHILLPSASFGGQTMAGAETMAGAAMLGMSPRLVSLLSANYRVTVVGWGEVAGRRARIVAALRRRGGVAARFWLDRQTTLPLRRQTFDPAGHVVSDAAFAQLRLGRTVGRRPAAAARPWDNALAPAQLTALRAQGWPLPGPLPGNLVLLGARQQLTGAGRVIDLDYSDGLCLVSVFMQRGHLPPRMTGWSEVALRGHRVYADDSSGQGIAWSAHGFVYTVVAAAPAQTVGQVVAALPHDSTPGFLARLGRGLHRLWTILTHW